MLPMDKMIITQTFTTARWQIVVKKSEATNQTKDQNNYKTKTQGLLLKGQSVLWVDVGQTE